MANALYTRSQATAERLIAKYGHSGTIKRTTPRIRSSAVIPTVMIYPAKLVPMTYDL